jgi:hypothetical protein
VQDFNSASYQYDLTLSAASVPEPEIYAALAVGLVFLMARLRHVKRWEKRHVKRWEN